MTLLANVDVFQDFAAEGLDRLAARARPRTFRTGAALLRQGEVSGVMYVIVRGLVRKQRSHPALSEPAVVLELGPGESVGELGVLDLAPWPETVIALEDTDVLELSAVVLAETMLLYPLPSVGLLSSLSRSVRTLADLEACAQALRFRFDGTAPGG
jgi:CRP/FNR family transcriptional regulator, cyclic AMP receptor protein